MVMITALDKQFVAPTYGRFPVELTEGKGSTIYDTAGKAYIDMTSGIGVTAFGIADEKWLAAVTEQAGKLQHVSNLYYTEPCAQVAKRLCEKTGLSKVFFCNSGAEANECAIKYARKYSMEKKGSEFCNIITLKNSFHGRTLTTLSATGQEHYHELFQPLTPGFLHVEAGDVEGLKKTVAEHPTAGIMIEIVQGEGGVIPLTKEFTDAIAEICAQQDIPLMVDEVQTGNGRTGTLYAYMQYGLQPDIVSTAKGLGGGLPIGATMVSEKLANVLQPGDQGSTYGGNPMCCAGALSVLTRLDDAFLAQVKEKSDYVFEALQNAKGVKAVTGLGLMIGIQTVKPAKEVVAACMERGVLCLTAKDKVRLLPALNIPLEQLKQAVEILKDVCQEGQ